MMQVQRVRDAANPRLHLVPYGDVIPLSLSSYFHAPHLEGKGMLARLDPSVYNGQTNRDGAALEIDNIVVRVIPSSPAPIARSSNADSHFVVIDADNSDVQVKGRIHLNEGS
jgi:hypothetical protein